MALNEVMEGLPFAMREQVEGYVRFVEDVLDELLAEQQVRHPTAAQRATAMTLATLWKLWRSVDAQYWLLRNSLDLLRESGVREIAVGGSRYSEESDRFQALVRLRTDFVVLLRRLDLGELSSIHRLSDVIELSVDRAG